MVINSNDTPNSFSLELANVGVRFLDENINNSNNQILVFRKIV